MVLVSPKWFRSPCCPPLVAGGISLGEGDNVATLLVRLVAAVLLHIAPPGHGNALPVAAPELLHKFKFIRPVLLGQLELLRNV